jgi:hypothetical protein
LCATEETKFLYEVPFSIVSMEFIDMDHPDFNKFPALAKAKGCETLLKHEKLFLFTINGGLLLSAKVPVYS